MFEPCPAAEKRIRDLASEAANQFDTSLLHNRVHEQVKGQWGRTNDLARLLDLAERAYQLAEDRDHDSEIFGAAEQLNDQVDALVAEQVAQACAAIIEDADDWTDTWGDDEVAAAQHEAREWLQLHLEAADRAGVREVVADA